MSATHTMRARREGYIPSRLTSTPDRPVVSSGRYDSATGVKYAPSKRYPTFKPEPKMYVSVDDVSRLSTKGYPSGVSKDERKLIVSYWSSSHWIAIFEPFNPWKVLELPSSQVPFWEVKSTFKSSITQLNPQKRAMVSIAYHMITSSGERYKRVYGTDEYVVGRRDHFLLAACGHADELARMINYRQHIVEDKDEYGRTLLYTASKSGFYDVCKLLLQKGASVDEPQRDGSTPLHGAAYFGHELVVGLLLQHGARTDIKNNWGHTALDESATRKIQHLIQSASFDYISSLAAELKRKQLVLSVRVIEYKGSVIAKEFVRNASILDTRTRAEWNNIHRNWEVAWHGTKYRHLQSILEKGLLPAGSSGIKPAEGHFSLGEVHFGVRNWAAAIFVSPSILYASHAAYSERVFSESQKWCAHQGLL